MADVTHLILIKLILRSSFDPHLYCMELKDLTDAQISELTQQLLDEEQKGVALLGPRESLDILQSTFDPTSPFFTKMEALKRDFTGLRRIRGDGNCFYRAYAWSFILHSQVSIMERAHSRERIDLLLPMLKTTGFQEDIYMDFAQSLLDFLPRGSEPLISEAELELRLNNDEVSMYIVTFLRLITSAFLHVHQDDFLPFLFDSTSSTVIDPESGLPDMARFRSFEVEAIGKEADHVQISALTRALQTPLDVIYLDAQTQTSDTVEKVRFEDYRSEKPITLLYRPGHYDILV